MMMKERNELNKQKPKMIVSNPNPQVQTQAQTQQQAQAPYPNAQFQYPQQNYNYPGPGPGKNQIPTFEMKGVISLWRVSKWYGQVIGLNDISLNIKKGITGLLGPNGAGKSTMFKIITGQIKQGIGQVSVTGKPVWNNYSLWQNMGYCPEYDSFWGDQTGFKFIRFLARLHGMSPTVADKKTKSALELVGMLKDSHRKIKGYSKGMRQRLKVGQALLHDPDILILDEPLTGADPIAKYTLTQLFQDLESEGKTLVISSHVLEEVERITDNILLIHKGRLLAEGRIQEIRDLIDKYPHNIFIATKEIAKLAKRLIREEFVLSIAKYPQSGGLMVQTQQPDRFYTEIPKIIVAEGVEISQMTSTDDNLDAVFRYLVD
jgi:ABC-2 type transport system ATP-binding protein